MTSGQPAAARVLMCPPEHFEVAYSINPWMRMEDPPDRDTAFGEWDGLLGALQEAGATVDTLQPVPGLPDQVFTSDHGFVVDGRFVRSRPRYPERRPEVDHAAAWFNGEGYEVVALPEDGDVFVEGGELTMVGDRMVSSYGFRTTPVGIAALSEATGRDILALELVDPRLYHLDVAFFAPDAGHAIYVPEAFTPDGVDAILGLVGDAAPLSMEEALTFCCNGIAVGDTVIVPSTPPRVRDILSGWGYRVVETPVGEFQKAGGSVHCLTLRIS
jgi:N-dimethylarginine dimethylaminohydrolase